MKKKEYCKKYENCILTFIVMLLNVILMGICFDFYYDLNDDTMMKDIMSGVYTGTPDGHNMQTLYLLGTLISMCYRLCGRIPWYGLFLCLCQFGCFYLLGVRLTGLIDHRYQAARAAAPKAGRTMADKEGNCAAVRQAEDKSLKGTNRADWISRLAALLVLSLFQWGVCLQHLVNVQYTITCAMMSATAIFLFVTTPETDSAKQFVMKNIPSMLLVIIAYQLRTEMLLLTLPFAALAGMYRWAEEEKIFTKENWQKYGTVAGVILAGLLLSRCVDLAAYGSAQWQDFLKFFDARTTVYDFYPEVVTQDDFSEDLEQLGITPVQQALLRSYNFGLDDTIDTQMLDRTAGYAADTAGASRDRGAIFKEKSKLYLYRIFHAGDAPYNYIVLWAYAALLAAELGACFENTAAGKAEKGNGLRRYAFIGLIVLAVIVRTAVWMFLLMRGRDPERITHSLYLVEFALLTAGFVRRIYTSETKNYVLHGMTTLLLIYVAANLMPGIRTVQYGQGQRETVNRDWQEIDAYCRAHEDNFYFEDVYSTVAFSQKMFADVNHSFANYDILGGWICKSPLYREKLARYDIDSAADALLHQDNVYLIMSNVEAADQGFDWMIDYYAGKGIVVSVTRSDTINENYAVYEVK